MAPRLEMSPRRVRVFFNGIPVVDSNNTQMLFGQRPYPLYYFPPETVATDLLSPSGRTEQSPSRGTATFYDVVVDGDRAADAAWSYEESPVAGLGGLLSFDWSSLDVFEEDEQVYVHPKDPYSRVDILRSSRHVEVSIDGQVVADTTRPTILFETGLPARYYIPKIDVRMDLMQPSTLHTDCPYKGTASYWSPMVNGTLRENLAWEYPVPTHESVKVAGLVSFYNEKVDVTIDGVLQERPRTHFA
ncbi:MAG: DUF427 domain-containing protein [Acidimicrobiia bacterium]|nr:DUF427 domain-containing protein [Acidimicrobiia bacterium]